MSTLLALVFFFQFPAFAGTENQNQIANAQFKDGDLFIGKVVNHEKKANVRLIEYPAKPWPVKFTKEGDRVTEVMVNRAGVIEEKFTPDVPGFPAYFVFNGTRLTMYDNVMYYYNWKNAAPEVKYMLAHHADHIKKKTIEEHEAALAKYLAEAFANQTNARGDMVAEQKAKQEKEKLENSIKGKDIKKIEIVWISPESECGMQSKIKYGIKATAADGKVFSTPNLGGKTPFEDYDLTCIGALPGDEALQVESDASKIKNNQITFTAKSKYHSLSATSSIKLSYNTPVSLAYRGEPGCGTAMYSVSGRSGGRGKNLIINATANANGDLILVEVADAMSGAVLARLKVRPGVTVTIDISGGSGCSGSSSSTSNGGNGGNGGHAGDVIINRDPSAMGLSLNIIAHGGNGGKGGKGAHVGLNGSDGSSGDDGSKTENISNVQLNF